MTHVLSIVCGGVAALIGGPDQLWARPDAWVAIPWTAAAIIFGFVIAYLPVMLLNNRRANRIANELTELALAL